MHHEPTGYLDFTIQRGHSAARLLEVEHWRNVTVEPGWVSADCHLPEGVRNVSGSLFGGFTPTYIDYVSVWCAMTRVEARLPWLLTVRMQVEYLEPVTDPGFTVRGTVINVRRNDYLVETRLHRGDLLLAHGLATLRRVNRSLVDLAESAEA